MEKKAVVGKNYIDLCMKDNSDHPPIEQIDESKVQGALQFTNEKKSSKKNSASWGNTYYKGHR